MSQFHRDVFDLKRMIDSWSLVNVEIKLTEEIKLFSGFGHAIGIRKHVGGDHVKGVRDEGQTVTVSMVYTNKKAQSAAENPKSTIWALNGLIRCQ